MDSVACCASRLYLLLGHNFLTDTVYSTNTLQGRKYSLNQSPYKGVEYLWNHRNFWVCMQQALPHSDCRALPNEISWDLNDPTKW